MENILRVNEALIVFIFNSRWSQYEYVVCASIENVKRQTCTLTCIKTIYCYSYILSLLYNLVIFEL